jgi:hypothetical protein
MLGERLKLVAEGARGRFGEVARGVGPEGVAEGEGKTADNAGRILRVWAGIVRRSAAGLAEGVWGRVGGTL